MPTPLLKLTNLHTSFFTDAGEVKAVRGVSFSLEKGKTIGLVGESGCGKSVTALSILRLIPFPGRIVFKGDRYIFLQGGSQDCFQQASLQKPVLNLFQHLLVI